MANAGRPVTQQIDGGRACRLRRLVEHERRVKEVDSEHIARALEELVDRRGRQHGQHASALAELERAEIAQQPLDVPAQLRVEEHAVPSLEHDLPNFRSTHEFIA